MTQVGLLACHAGLLPSAAAPHISLALSLRPGIATSQENNLLTNLFASGQDLLRTTAAPTAAEKTQDCLAIIDKLRQENLKDLYTHLSSQREAGLV
ncbi:SAG family member [Eimeria necatrix]|uniref:SAG family member n=1 Tax=Eimeria necatrix TaxID=51315 RepID=U6N0W2_9EIME|nr:SAG family member [Eimeria necatrix]CDJ70088.1 SAG family member [Eimeria necatrix]